MPRQSSRRTGQRQVTQAAEGAQKLEIVSQAPNVGFVQNLPNQLGSLSHSLGDLSKSLERTQAIKKVKQEEQDEITAEAAALAGRELPEGMSEVGAAKFDAVKGAAMGADINVELLNMQAESKKRGDTAEQFQAIADQYVSEQLKGSEGTSLEVNARRQIKTAMPRLMVDLTGHNQKVADEMLVENTTKIMNQDLEFIDNAEDVKTFYDDYHTDLQIGDQMDGTQANNVLMGTIIAKANATKDIKYLDGLELVTTAGGMLLDIPEHRATVDLARSKLVQTLTTEQNAETKERSDAYKLQLNTDLAAGKDPDIRELLAAQESGLVTADFVRSHINKARVALEKGNEAGEKSLAFAQDRFDLLKTADVKQGMQFVYDKFFETNPAFVIDKALKSQELPPSLENEFNVATFSNPQLMDEANKKFRALTSNNPAMKSLMKSKLGTFKFTEIDTYDFLLSKGVGRSEAIELMSKRDDNLANFNKEDKDKIASEIRSRMGKGLRNEGRIYQDNLRLAEVYAATGMPIENAIAKSLEVIKGQYIRFRDVAMPTSMLRAPPHELEEALSYYEKNILPDILEEFPIPDIYDGKKVHLRMTGGDNGAQIGIFVEDYSFPIEIFDWEKMKEYNETDKNIRDRQEMLDQKAFGKQVLHDFDNKYNGL